MAIVSDWDDWLPREIATASPETARIWYLGCNGIAIKGTGGTTVFIDPYLGTGDPPRTVRMIPVPFEPGDIREATAVLATHEHTDHVHGPTQAPLLAETDASFFGPRPSLDVVDEEDWVGRWEVDSGQFQEVSEGDQIPVGEFTVHVEPAHDPDADHSVSYVIDHPAGTFFHGGDARPSPAFEAIGEEYDIAVGALAFGSAGVIPDRTTGEPTRTVWYNDENEVIEAARQLRLDRLLPTHWDMWRGLTANPTALHAHAHSFEHPRSLDIVEIGDSITI